MSKKNFTQGLDSLLGGQPERAEGGRPATQPKAITESSQQGLPGEPPQRVKRGRPVTQTKAITKSSQEGTKENETRATFIVNEELLEKVKYVAYWERVLIKDVVNKALQEAVAKFEKANGEIKPTPKK